MGIVIENFGKGHASCLSKLWTYLVIIRVNGKVIQFSKRY